MPNAVLARQIYDQITEFPESHNQLLWGKKTECGTVCCVAGHAGLITGEAYFDGWGNIVAKHFMTINGMAQDLLGIDDRLATFLFYVTDNEGAVSVMRQLADDEPVDLDREADLFEERLLNS